MSALEAEIVTDAAALESLAPDWWDLWRRVPGALPFTSPAWLIPWWRHFEPGKLFTIAVWANGRLVAIAPLYIEDGALGRRLLPLGISLSDHLDVLVDPDAGVPAAQPLVSAALSRAEAWDRWELENLLPDATALRLPSPSGYEDQVHEQEQCPVLRIPPGATELAPLLPGRKRRNVRLARNRCERRGRVFIERANGVSALDALEHLIRLHGLRWRGQVEGGVLAREAVRRLHRDAAPALAAASMLRLYTLAVSGEVVAAYYGLTWGGWSCAYLTGFDPAWEFEAPLTLLMAHAFQEAITEDCREIDLLRGGEAHKYSWGATDRWNLKRSLWRSGDA
jgi:CelD/BcsL family acetyltransferase involved in cellulose biosynthesis